MAVRTGELGVLSIDVKELVSFRIYLLESFAAALRENEMACSAVACFDRRLAIGGHMLAVVAPKATVPILVPDEIRM